MDTRSVAACRALLSIAAVTELPELIVSLESDERAGVRAAVTQARRRLERHEAEVARVRALFHLERSLREGGARYIAGVDEVGRGALAGPLTAAAVVLPADVFIEHLDDSKRLRPPLRERVSEAVRDSAVSFHVAHVSAEEIDALGVASALRTAMRRAIQGLSVAPDHVVIDGLPVGTGYPETAVVKGDATVACIAAASVIAKVERDAMMVRFAEQYPQFGFEINKGYGTPEHLTAIAAFGPCALHRRCYAPCSDHPTLF